VKPLVVHIIDRLPPDGAERLLCEVLRYRSDQFDYHLICLAEGGEFEPVIRNLGVPITILGKRRGVDLRMLWHLWSWLRKHRPAVVHTHLFTADTWGRLAAWMAQVPCIVSTVHSVNSWQGRVHRLVDRGMALVTDRLIACTALVADKLRDVDGISAHRVITLANGVDLERFEDVDGRDLITEFDFPHRWPLFAVLGRLEPVKGQGYLLECLAQCRERGVHINLLLIGDGPDRAALEQQVEDAELLDRVRFAGFRRDVPEMLASIDVLVIPSRWEGLPMALLEAMALGRPVIAHAVGGIGDVVEPGVQGVLVPAGQSQEMASAIAMLAGDVSLRQRMGAAARQRVREHYSAEVLSAQYEALYRDVLGSTQSAEGEPR